LGGSPDDGEEGVTVPGDDDQLSYVSAPASDYSVTTVGSDMLNTSRFSDEEEKIPRDVTIVPKDVTRVSRDVTRPTKVSNRFIFVIGVSKKRKTERHCRVVRYITL